MRQLHPAYRPDLSLDDLRRLYAYPADRPWVRANMVSSLDGAATVDGRSAGLSSAADKTVFDVLRGLCDVVLVGAGTARAEGYRAPGPKPAYAAQRAGLGQRPAPVLALVSGRLDLDPASDLFTGAERTLVLTAAGSGAGARSRLAEVADVVVAGEERVDVSAAIDVLVERGLPRVLCEGGPHLLADVTRSDRLDELCLTTAPYLAGGPGPRIAEGLEPPQGSGPDGLDLVHLLEQESTLLARYVRRERPVRPPRP